MKPSELPENGLGHNGDGENIRAYYFSFEATRVAEIDRLLASVAAAGCEDHHTMGWSDASDSPRYKGLTPVEVIQEYADRAADVINQNNRRIAELEVALAEVNTRYETM